MSGSDEKTVRREYYCPIIGTGLTIADERVPLISKLVHKRTWMMQPLDDNANCIATIFVTQQEHKLLRKHPDVVFLSGEDDIDSLLLKLTAKSTAADKARNKEMHKRFKSLKQSRILRRKKHKHKR